ncbi:uncharacterized protein F4817DRAFT_357367 [Daldinia loculata]|uniref:uncharacterized protein n=1 Tax=Daldinia loculata TaxID=103429 RepID=UPI0020C49E4D|nr:uncharacterized protein F4817DRAFT_357367 [Daldinia loculata]KAI1649658.1 hypothetical protein F4817DRAFT_357367 [Daldinia loculata]
MSQYSNSPMTITSSGSKKVNPDIPSPITKGYLGEVGRVIFDDASRNVAKEDIALYYKHKAELEKQGLQREAEWDGTPIDYAMYYYHRFFHDEGCICPHEFGPVFSGPGKWVGGAYNCYNPKEFVPALPVASGSPPNSYLANGHAGESSAKASKSLLDIERQRWDKIQAYWRHESIESPFVPATFDEYLKFKNDTVKAKQLAIIKMMEDPSNSISHKHSQACAPRVRMSPKLLEIHNTDNLSLVSSRVSVWHENRNLFVPIDWPLRWEYEYYQGQMPLPRTQEVDYQFEDMVDRYKLFPAFGPLVPRQFRRIAHRALEPTLDGMTRPEYWDIVWEGDMKIPEFETEELTGFTQQLLQDIDEEQPVI